MKKKSFIIGIVSVLAGIFLITAFVFVIDKLSAKYEAAKRQEVPRMDIYEEVQTVNKEEALTVSSEEGSGSKINWIKDYPKVNSNEPLKEDRWEKKSFEITMETNKYDREVIKNCTIDFSDVKITMLGDSITCAVNLDEEDAAEYCLPALLKKILGCKEVVNFGIGGSFVSRTGLEPMVERYQEIEKDSDIIIVFGGINDCMNQKKDDFGSLNVDPDLCKGTFCGDLDELCSSIQYEYQIQNENDCKLLYVNPSSSIIAVELYEKNPDNKFYQTEYAKAINTIAPKYGFEVIDLYNNNILNSIDFDIDRELVPDGIHMNKEGYRILAEHIASQIIQRIEKE